MLLCAHLCRPCLRRWFYLHSNGGVMTSCYGHSDKQCCRSCLIAIFLTLQVYWSSSVSSKSNQYPFLLATPTVAMASGIPNKTHGIGESPITPLFAVRSKSYSSMGRGALRLSNRGGSLWDYGCAYTCL